LERYAPFRRIYVLRNEEHYVATTIVLSSVRPSIYHLVSASNHFHGYLQMLSSKSEFLEKRIIAFHMYRNIYPHFPHSVASSKTHLLETPT